MKFLVSNYSCLQNPWLRGYRPQIPVLSVLWPQLNLLNPPRKKLLGTPLSHDTMQVTGLLLVTGPGDCNFLGNNYVCTAILLDQSISTEHRSFYPHILSFYIVYEHSFRHSDSLKMRKVSVISYSTITDCRNTILRFSDLVPLSW